MSNERLIPTGSCWCGCGREAKLGKFFAPGHDKVAEAALVAVRYQASVPRLLTEHGFGPEQSVTDAAVAEGSWERCEHCSYVGAPASVYRHTLRDHGQTIEEQGQGGKDVMTERTPPASRELPT